MRNKRNYVYPNVSAYLGTLIEHLNWMKNICNIISTILILYSCGLTDKKQDSEEVNSTIELEANTSTIKQVYAQDTENSNNPNPSLKKDSLRDPYHNAYLTDLSYKEIGELILKNEARPMDNHVTFELLDTISNCDIEHLGFYLRVFENIMEKSDGALAEVVGMYTWQFIKSRPEIFLNHIDTTKSENIKNWANYTVYEMYFSFPEDSLVYQCQQFTKNLKNIEQNDGLSLFEETMISAAKSIIE